MTTLSGDLRTLSREAFVYFYPLVTMDVSRRQAVNAPADRPGCGSDPGMVEPSVGIEPTTFRLQGGSSTTELQGRWSKSSGRRPDS